MPTFTQKMEELQYQHAILYYQDNEGNESKKNMLVFNWLLFSKIFENPIRTPLCRVPFYWAPPQMLSSDFSVIFRNIFQHIF